MGRGTLVASHCGLFLLLLLAVTDAKVQGSVNASDSGLINIDDSDSNVVPEPGLDSESTYDGSGGEDIDDGSGGRSSTEDEDEDEDETGSSGSPVGKTTKRTLTPCFQLYLSSNHLTKSYVPQCMESGAFHKRQCQGVKLNRKCWCVDPTGRKIEGTTMRGRPDCENGTNLGPCVIQLVKHSHGLLGEFKPQCTTTGKYKKIQCQAQYCWCVDAENGEIIGSKKAVPEKPTCDETTAASSTNTTTTTTTKKPEKKKGKNVPNYYIPNKQITTLPVEDTTMKHITTPDLDDSKSDVKSLQTHDQVMPITGQPGILAAIIAGAVVGLFCAILLVMFIVYRMRKKDEGSYPLDEPRKLQYSYTKAPNKEIYA